MTAPGVAANASSPASPPLFPSLPGNAGIGSLDPVLGRPCAALGLGPGRGLGGCTRFLAAVAAVAARGRCGGKPCFPPKSATHQCGIKSATHQCDTHGITVRIRLPGQGRTRPGGDYSLPTLFKILFNMMKEPLPTLSHNMPRDESTCSSSVLQSQPAHGIRSAAGSEAASTARAPPPPSSPPTPAPIPESAFAPAPAAHRTAMAAYPSTCDPSTASPSSTADSFSRRNDVISRLAPAVAHRTAMAAYPSTCDPSTASPF